MIAALVGVAPEVTPASLGLEVPLRDQVDLDSMDFLRFIVKLHKLLTVEIPEADYARLRSLNDFANYIADALGVPAT